MIKAKALYAAGKIAIATFIAVALCGCAAVAPASVNGECKVFADPGFAVQGKRLIDKQWVGKTQQAGIEVCGWHRPRQ